MTDNEEQNVSRIVVSRSSIAHSRPAQLGTSATVTGSWTPWHQYDHQHVVDKVFEMLDGSGLVYGRKIAKMIRE